MAEDEAPALEAPPQLHTLASTASAVMPALPLAGAGVPLVHAIPLERPPQAAPSAVPPPPVVASTVAPAPRPAPPRPAVVASRLALLASQAALPPAAAPTPSAGLENSIADVMVNRGPAAAKGEGGHTCELCGAVFAQSRYLADHRRTHSQIRPHKCDQCDAAFKRSGALTEHKRIHTGEKPFKCDRCDAAFAQAGHLARHKRTHLKRDGGNEETSGLHKRARNVLVGLGRRVYECDQCDEAFLNPAALATHMRVHDTVREHTCDLCGKAFLESSALAIHKKWTHGVEAQA